MAVHKTDGFDGRNSIPVKKTVLYCTGAVTRGDVIMIDTADTTNGAGFSIKQSDAADSPLACGVALQTLTAAGNCEIQFAGRTDLFTSSGAISVADLVGSDVAGDVQTAAAPTATLFPMGVCIDAFAGTTNDGIVMIFDKGFFSSDQ
jgi:hypothetical protein